MSTVLIVAQVIIIFLLITVVLIQRSSSGFSGLTSGAGKSEFGSLAKITTVIALLFFFNSLLLAVYLGRQRPKDIVVEVEKENEVFQPDISGNVDR